MVSVASRMLALQTPVPEFALPDVEGKLYGPEDFSSAKGLLVMFISNHCPYVQFIGDRLAELTADFQERGLGVVGINPNVATHPEDSLELMVEEIAKRGYKFPYLIDEDQQVAKQFTAACTPDLFLFNADRKLAYRGQFDDARPRRIVPVTGKDLEAAVDAVLEGRPVTEAQRPSAGCNIKWIEGSEPDYFG